MEFPDFDVVDLSHPLTDEMPVYPGDKPFKMKRDKKSRSDDQISHTLTLGEHIGTHVDAPRHFDPEGLPIHRIHPSRLVLTSVMVDVRERTMDNPEYKFTVSDFFEWEEEHGWIPPHSMVLLHTGWGFRWHKPDEYMGEDELGTLHFPGFGTDVAEFLAEERSVRALGIDTASVDVGRSSTFPVHRTMLQRGVILAENLANLHRLPEKDFLVSIGVLNVKEGSGAPARVLAIVPR